MDLRMPSAICDTAVVMGYMERHSSVKAAKAMTRDHTIRLAIRGLHGEVRTRAIDYLTRFPKATKQALAKTLMQAKQPKWSNRRSAKWGHDGARNISWNMRFTAEEYLAFRDKATEAGLSMAQLMRVRLGLAGTEEQTR